jgi:predicted dehydrogenase
MFNQRTDPRYRWVRTRIQDGTLGRINRVSWTITDWFRSEQYYRAGGWRATWAGEGGGVLLNQCPHQLDLWQWMFGMPKRVQAFCRLGRFHDIEVEDDVTAYLEHDGGMTGVFITTTGETPGSNRLELAAENGRVVIDGKDIIFDRNETPSSTFCATSDKPFAQPKTQREVHTVDDFGPQHLGILKNFTAAIREQEALIAPAPEGIHSVELGNAMLQSGLNGHPVDLPLDGAAYEKALCERIRKSTFTRNTRVSSIASAADMSESF